VGEGKRKETNENRESGLLKAGLEKYGVGNWSQIQLHFLPDWGGAELRIKTARLLGRQSIVAYHGQKLTEEMIAREYEWNKALGEEVGCWKGGVLVNDDAGVVATRIEERKKLQLTNGVKKH